MTRRVLIEREVVARVRDAFAFPCEARDGRTVHLTNGERACLLTAIDRLAGAVRALVREASARPDLTVRERAAIERGRRVLADVVPPEEPATAGGPP